VEVEMAATETAWQLRGEYLENCNCDVVCPCLFSTKESMTSKPTQGACEVGFGFHVDDGRFGDVSLDGLNVALIARTPGPMADGNWQVALYLDDQADDGQREALQAIFTGSAGGVMGSLAPLIGEVLGVRSASISWRKEGKERAVVVDDVMHMTVHAAPSINPDGEIWASNAHPFAPEAVAMAVGAPNSTYTDHGLRWDNSGKNAHYAPINWSN
jgi:hypothetical protein